MSKKWEVKLPVCGSMYVHVEADNEEAAIEAALAVGWGVKVRSTDGGYVETCEEWEALKEVSRGNVCYAPCTSAEATEIDDD